MRKTNDDQVAAFCLTIEQSSSLNEWNVYTDTRTVLHCIV